MDSGTLALWLVGALWVLFALWVWLSQKFMENAHKLHALLRERQDGLEKTQRLLMGADDARAKHLRELEERTAGVEALLVSTVGQETEDFCKAMDALMDRMEKPKEKPEQKEKLTLSKEHCGKFGKKGGKRD